MKKISRLVSIFVIVSLFLCGCGGAFGIYKYNKKPDDNFSRSVHKFIGDDFHYRGKEIGYQDEVRYKYTIINFDVNAINNFVNAINESLNGEQRKVTVHVCVYWLGGKLEEGVLSLHNYSDSQLEKADYDGFYTIHIYDLEIADEPFFQDPSTYKKIKGIKKLQIDKQMQQRAESKEIDWYEWWPSLEEIKITEY